MGNNSNFDKLVSILASFVNDNEIGSEKTKEKFFGKSDIAILTFIGILLTTILMVTLRFAVQLTYWYLVDLFSIVLLAVLAYFIVISKQLKKNNV